MLTLWQYSQLCKTLVWCWSERSYRALHRNTKGKTFDLKPKRWSVLFVTVHTHALSFTLMGTVLNRAKKAIWSASDTVVVTSHPTGFTRFPLFSTKGQNNNIKASTESSPPSKNISVRVGLTYLFSRRKTQSRVYADSCSPSALRRTEGELWRSWPSGTIKCHHQTHSWDRLLAHRSIYLLWEIHMKLLKISVWCSQKHRKSCSSLMVLTDIMCSGVYSCCFTLNPSNELCEAIFSTMKASSPSETSLPWVTHLFGLLWLLLKKFGKPN